MWAASVVFTLIYVSPKYLGDQHQSVQVKWSYLPRSPDSMIHLCLFLCGHFAIECLRLLECDFIRSWNNDHRQLLKWFWKFSLRSLVGKNPIKSFSGFRFLRKWFFPKPCPAKQQSKCTLMYARIGCDMFVCVCMCNMKTDGNEPQSMKTKWIEANYWIVSGN